MERTCVRGSGQGEDCRENDEVHNRHLVVVTVADRRTVLTSSPGWRPDDLVLDQLV